ncbi:6-phosphofructokinase, alpha subunit [Sorochytrium milnesiophthora]
MWTSLLLLAVCAASLAAGSPAAHASLQQTNLELDALSRIIAPGMGIDYKIFAKDMSPANTAKLHKMMTEDVKGNNSERVVQALHNPQMAIDFFGLGGDLDGYSTLSDPELGEATDMVTYALVSMCNNEDKLKTWSCFPLCDTPQTQGTQYVASFVNAATRTRAYTAVNPSKKAIIAAFRPSIFAENWIKDFDFALIDYPLQPNQGMSVHQGFWASYEPIRETLAASVSSLHAANPDYTVYILGISLGGAMANFAAADLTLGLNLSPDKVKVYTYGSPRAGNSAYADLLGSLNVDMRHFINENDIVPHLPLEVMGYSRSIGENYRHNGQVYECHGKEDPNCSNSRVPFLDPLMHLSALGTLFSMCLDNTAMSHVALAAPTEELLQRASHFYSLLGFRAVKQQSNEHWLVCFDAVDKPLTLRLHVSPVSATSATDAVVESASTPTRSQLENARATLCLVFSDLDGFEAMCRERNYAVQRVRLPFEAADAQKSEHQTALLVTDPLGNVITLTCHAHPFSSYANPMSVAAARHSATQTHQRTTATSPGVPDAATSASVTPHQLRGKGGKVALLTSGGDSQGMNAAVRSVVRMAHVMGMQPYAVYDGYQGLVDDRLKPLKWDDVRGLLSLGGTVIGTARCAAFRQREGRLTGAYNLVKNGIDALVVVGGDGSLTGADMLRGEWPSLLDELVQQKRITEDQRKAHAHLNIVGLVGSIDNDMSSTDMTIGCVSALHRICEAVDAIESTALSHGRAFVIEVMGRHCGWLALMAAIATGADWLFIPERPPMTDNWEQAMCSDLKKLQEMGQRRMIVIVSEGAIDKNLKPIKAEYVRDVLSKLSPDTRVTTLGHVQRGGTPCYYDRYLGTVQGVRAIEEIIRATPDTPSPMIGISHNKITVQPLMKAVEQTRAVAKAIEAANFARAMELRDPEFAPAYDNFVAMNIPRGSAISSNANSGLRIGILHIGAPAGAMNAATRVATLLALNKGHVPLAIHNGFGGLLSGDIRKLSWMDVNDWMAKGGSELGTNRSQPVDLGLCAYQLQKHNIHALLFVGGFEAFTALHTMYSNRESYPAFCIPMVHIPATISNNAPGTDYSLGSDTALNVIVESCDCIKQSASASRKRVFVVEVHGGNVGYLATMGGLAGGATSTYIPEEGVDLTRLKEDVDHLIRRYSKESIIHEGRVILRNESVSSTYTTEVVSSILRTEANGLFDARTAVLGHLQQGGSPSPLDRVRAVRFTGLCIEWIERHCQQETPVEPPIRGPADDAPVPMRNGPLLPNVYTRGKESACVVGVRGADVVFTPVADLLSDTDMEKRKPKSAWWMECRGLIRVLAKYTMDDTDDE